MKTLVVSNQKGGVGKTTLAFHLAHAAIEKKLRLLFIDCDTQGNSSFSLSNQAGVYSAFSNTLFNSKIDWSRFHTDDGLVLFKGEAGLADCSMANIEQFAENIGNAQAHFDLCIIDTAPTIGVLQIAPIVVANYAVSPIELEHYSVQGIESMLTTMQGLLEYNPELKFLGMLPNRVRKESKRQMQALEMLKRELSAFLYPDDLYLPERQSIAEANAEQVPVWKLKKSAARETAKFMRSVTNHILSHVATV